MASTDIDDLLAPVFFLSYPQDVVNRLPTVLPSEADRHVRQFFEDLSAHVGELLGSAVGEYPGFMEHTALSGESWGPDVLAAAGTCHVFVPLISRRYLASAWCAKEWDAFTRRSVTRRPVGSQSDWTAILPITWSPTRDDELPSAIKRLRFFSPVPRTRQHVDDQYQKNGVQGLLMQDEDSYRTLVWRLARRVVDTYYSYQVAPRIPADSSELSESFRGDGE